MTWENQSRFYFSIVHQNGSVEAKDMGRTKVVISVVGGVVNAVCTDSPNLEVYLVDFDALETDPKAGCSARPYPIDSLDDFRSAVKADVHRYPGLKKVLARIAK